MKKILLLFTIVSCLSTTTKAQGTPFFNIIEVANIPMPISNNAVAEGYANNIFYVYSFGGIDSTKIWSGINKKSFRYNTISDVWDTIPDLPNINAVIAAGASYVDSIIYIMGGYQVLSNGSEISSNIVNRFNPRTNTYLSDGVNIPLAIDDHVQAVYKDSLIYLITGWSNTGNFPNVQIYDPTNDNWLTGTSVPNNNTYKAFGASGTIIENTIYYHGGASTGTNFPGQSTLRIGQINATDPTQITWSVQSTNFVSYRSACSNLNGFPFWFGGSEITYNYNGISYNGSGGVPLKSQLLGYYLNNFDSAYYSSSANLPMDLRGIAARFGTYYIAGGMINNQKVSNKTYRIEGLINSINELNNSSLFQLYPNPTSENINLIFKEKEDRKILIINVVGKEVFSTESDNTNLQLNVSNYPKGIYFVKVKTSKSSKTQKIVIK